MPFCQECGNQLSDTAKFCPDCGTKQGAKAELLPSEIGNQMPESKVNSERPQIKNKKVTKTLKVKKIQDAVLVKENPEITKRLKKFFMKPEFPKNEDPADGPEPWYVFAVIFILGFLVCMMIGVEEDKPDCIDRDYWGQCNEYGSGGGGGICYLFGIVLLVIGIGLAFQGSNISNAKIAYQQGVKQWENDIRSWRRMSPEVLFDRLDECQTIAAKSSFQALGINKDAKPSEGGIIRPPAYSYGPHLDFSDVVGNPSVLLDIFGRVDDDGIGKGAGYYKICEDTHNPGLYTREYDMMVVHFTVNQILVYKCVFDILEMTKRLEESYEWSYKHVVGINISGDDKEKKLGDSISVTGTKYMVISAASGDKIEIILGAETNELVDGKKKRSHIGGEDKIFEVANAAIANVRQAIRDKAG